jgi:hypothetical protein
LPYLRKKLRQNYVQFLINFYSLQNDHTQQQILQSAEKIKHQHDMTFAESIRQAMKLRKDLFQTLWPYHDINESDTNNDTENQET